MLDAGTRDVGVGQRADPHVAVVEVEQRPVVAARDEPDLAHARLDVLEEHADREQVVVGVRPELDVLVPLHLFPAVRGLEVELGVVELHVRPDEVGDDVDDRRRRRELPVRLVQVGRRAEPAQPRLVGGVAGVEVEDHVRFGERAALLDELVGHRAQPFEPRSSTNPGTASQPCSG